ncbi:MAG: hypothetical protein K2X49_07290 [Acetobacteraceae bacterium]|nr:hypothetical protein [Acetobacteraceae bacterium]
MPWAGCVWGLPFLTVLAPSERHAAGRGKRHETPTDWGRQALLQVARRLPGRRVIAVADGSFAAIALLRDLAPHLAVVTRLRLDACLCRPSPPRRPGAIGRLPARAHCVRMRSRNTLQPLPGRGIQRLRRCCLNASRSKGARLPSLAQRRRGPATRWRRVTVRGWYGRTTRRLDVTTGTALWHHPGLRVAIRWGPGQCPERCATRAARRRRGPSSAPTYTPTPPTSCAGSSDLAILRTTPALLALFSLVALWASQLAAEQRQVLPERVRWYPSRSRHSAMPSR